MQSHWLRDMAKSLVRSSGRSGARRAASRRRPALDVLEGRVLLSDGVLDPTFGNQGRQVVNFDLGQNNQDQAFAMAIQDDGKIVLAGRARTASTGNIDFAVVRLNVDGTPDTSFGPGGKRTIDFGAGNNVDDARAVAIAPDGKIVVAGQVQITGVSNFDFGVARLNTNGTLDTSFDGDGKTTISFNGPNGGLDLATSVAVQSADRKIVVGGTVEIGKTDYDFGVVRLNENGSLDTSFDGDGKQTVAFNLGIVNGLNQDKLNALALSSGKIVLAGSVPRGVATPVFDFAVARLTETGALDTSFAPGGPDGDGKLTVNVGGNNSGEAANAVIALNDGRIVVAGQSRPSGSPDADFAVIRLGANGTLDSSFDGDGRKIISFNLMAGGKDNARAMVAAPGDKVIIAGEAQRTDNGNDDIFDDDYEMAVVRLDSSGNLDPDFGIGGKQTVAFNQGGANHDAAYGVGLQPSGKVILGGLVQRNNTGNFDFGAARLGPSPGTPGNNPPVAGNNLYEVAQDTPLAIPPSGVLADDQDPNGNPIVALRVADPLHGTLVLNPDGSFTYTPAPGFIGTDSFTYVAHDGSAASNTATVTIIVRPRDVTPPLAVQARLVRTQTRVGRRRVRVVTVEVTFNEALNPALAATPGLFQVAEVQGTRRRPRFRNVGIRAASYDAATRIVKLTLVGNRPFARGGRLTIQPQVTDAAGNALDGNADGVGGDVATLLFPRR